MKTENKKSSNGLKHRSLSRLFVLQITSTIVHIHVRTVTFLLRITSPDPESETADDDRIFQALSLSVKSVNLLALHYCVTTFPSHQRSYFRVKTVQ